MKTFTLPGLVVPQSVNYENLEGVENAYRDPDFNSLASQFEANRHSLLPTHAQAHLYAATRMLKPQHVVEIGTYHAGTSETIARGLSSNGSGHLHTVAPYEGEVVRANMAGWPDDLRRCTTFYEMNSAQFFAKFAESGNRVALTLIDGNHDYEFALFDLLMTARCAERSALVFVDNISQPGVYRAVRHFLERNPLWTLFGIRSNGAGGSMELFYPERSTIGLTDFCLLRAPNAFIVTPSGYSPGLRRTELSTATSVRIRLNKSEHRVPIRLRVILRVASVPDLEELVSEGCYVVEPGNLEQVFRLEKPLQSAVLGRPALRYVEVSIATAGEADALHLAAEPEVF